MGKKEESSKSISKRTILIATIVIIAVVAVFALSAFNMLPFTGNVTGTDTTANTASNDPSAYGVSRQTYFKEAFQPKREEYKLFEKAATFLNKPISEMPKYFSLKNEREIFSSLPPVPEEFSNIAYLLASGRYYSIGYLDEGYYKQPEFYPNFKEAGLKYWTNPDARYWTPHGFGTYPAEQWDTLKVTGRQEFTAVVFFYTGWGVQTFQGITLMPDSESLKNFDITITPQNFLLEPTYPKFYKAWAQKIVITGKLKEGIKAGNYAIGINVGVPPRELKENWEFEHGNLYFDGAVAIKPEGNQIQLNIEVQ